jgi:hypothetical protein
MSKDKKYVATDIYERQEADAQGLSGSVWSDIAEFDNYADMEEYFGDQDPTAFL